jgi:hypothetical protein
MEKQRAKSPAVTADLCTDEEAITDCLLRSKRSDWWNWSDGSRLYFWRWPECWQCEARDGAKAFHLSWPRRRPVARKVVAASQWHQDKMDEKIEVLIDRRYIRPLRKGEVMHVSTPNFPVDKTASDVRGVWSCTENGVNPSIFVPRLFMPTGDSMIRRLPPGGWMGDLDSGEMFNNYMLHPNEAMLLGVEITKTLQDRLKLKSNIMVWDRLLFGFCPAPLYAVRMFMRAIEVSRRSRHDKTSAFVWSCVRLNLPGSDEYDPALPRIAKIREDGLQACDEVTFVDDGRILGPTRELTTLATRQVAAGIQHMGCQEAARKRRPVGQRNGAWAGNVVHTDLGLDRRFISQEKWNKAREGAKWIKEFADKNTAIPYKQFLSWVGFLGVHERIILDSQFVARWSR